MPLHPTICRALFILYARHCKSSWEHIVQMSSIRLMNPRGSGTRAFGLCINIDSSNKSKGKEENEQPEYNTADIKLLSSDRRNDVPISSPLTFVMLLHDLRP